MVGTEPAGARFGEFTDFGTHPSFARSASTTGSLSPAISAASIARFDTPVMSLATDFSQQGILEKLFESLDLSGTPACNSCTRTGQVT